MGNFLPAEVNPVCLPAARTLQHCKVLAGSKLSAKQLKASYSKNMFTLAAEATNAKAKHALRSLSLQPT